VTEKERYVGDRNERGERHGEGKIEFTNGDVFEGEWFDGYPDDGMMKYANGDEYWGEMGWPDSECRKPDGEGVMNYADGDYYDGNWKNGRRHGKGEFHCDREGYEDIGWFKDGNFDYEKSQDEEITKAVFKELESRDSINSIWSKKIGELENELLNNRVSKADFDRRMVELGEEYGDKLTMREWVMEGWGNEYPENLEILWEDRDEWGGLRNPIED